MDYEQLIGQMTPEVHTALRRAVEIGKWPDGRPLSSEQRALCLEAVIAYEHRHLEEQERVGFIDRGSKREGETCGDTPSPGEEPEAPLKWSS